MATKTTGSRRTKVQTQTANGNGKTPATASKKEEPQELSARAKTVRDGRSKTRKAIQAIERVGKLATSSIYELTGDDTEHIIAALRASVDKLERDMKNPETAGEPEFDLKP